MQADIQIKLFASLSKLMPESCDHYPIEQGIQVLDLVRQLKIPENQAKLIFINGVMSELTSVLNGGERVGIFPPVGGG